MWIVELALKRPHTFIVLAILIAMFGGLSIIRMPIDIFPNINVPIVSCIWTYTGMSPFEMENLVTSVTERAMTSTVTGIDHMESMSLSGMSIIKIYLHQETPIGQSVAMVTSVGSAIRKTLPRGINPPFVTASSATDVPVLQLILRSDKVSEAKLFDIANNLLRTQLATIEGAITPFPYGGKYRQVMVDINSSALSAMQLSPADVVTAINNQNVLAPTGTAKFGINEYVIDINNMARSIDDLNNIPIKMVNHTVVFLKDVAFVHDGYQPQLNIVNLNGHRAVLFNVLKSGKASTLSVVQGAKKLLPRLRTLVPPDCSIEILTDQSLFVKACVDEVAHEAITAAGLTALMILALLGSWRSTLIVATSIPLAMLASIIGLSATGNTINSMTLGGLALAVGMLVDDATVEIENLHRNLAMGKDITTGILDSAAQVATPALVSTFSICIVFVPLVFLVEPSHSLFVPLGIAVVLAMTASYGLSRTLVPLMCKALLAHEHEKHTDNTKSARKPNPILEFFTSIHKVIDRAFDAARDAYAGLLSYFLDHAKVVGMVFIGFYVASLCLLPFIGEEYFPAIDGGELRLHATVYPGTRVEETERIYRHIEQAIRKALPEGEIVSILDNIGLPVSGVNYAYSDSQTISAADGEILVTLSEHRKHNTQYYEELVRNLVHKQFPQYSFYFQPADIVTQILNAGLPAPIAVHIIGMNKRENYERALSLLREIKQVKGAVDVCLHQVMNGPHVQLDVNRTKAGEMGLTQNDASQSYLVSLSSSFQTQPNFYLDRSNGTSYNLATQTPQAQITNLDQVANIPVTAQNSNNTNKPAQLLMNITHPVRDYTPEVVNHINVLRSYDIYTSVEGRDLGSVAKDIHTITEKYKKNLPRGNFIFASGQSLAMIKAFIALLGGLAFALVLVYLLLVVNFQSWTDPLIILMATPGALSGILWSLFVTHTHFSIPALMGTIMTVGVASANSILMVTFAKEQVSEGQSSVTAAYNAGFQRFRPVIMTATAMIIGMIPMAIGGGEGGSQNAPIGRAVVGGLIVATFSTLFFVPLFFSVLRRQKHPVPDPELSA